MAEHNDVGQWGEQVATEHLIKQGYAIVDRNVRVGGSPEIDIIAMKGDDIAFIEVKTRTKADYDPATAVNRRRMDRMCRFADNYVRERGIQANPRIDIICITGSPGGGLAEIEHLTDCFVPTTSGWNVSFIPRPDRD